MTGLEFEPEEHVYKFDGVVVPSVTGIIELWSEVAKLPAEILIPAGIRGSRVHLATELDDEGDLNEEWAEEVGMMGYVLGWRKFKRDHGLVTEAREQRIYHPLHRYAGTLDVLGKMLWPVGRIRRECRTLLDIKSGVKDPTHAMQTAGYSAPIGHRGKRGCVYLTEDGKYELEEHPSNNHDWADFLACKRQYDFNKKHGLL
jgi:hypothetical protein